jgi:hypothetical protein
MHYLRILITLCHPTRFCLNQAQGLASTINAFSDTFLLFLMLTVAAQLPYPWQDHNVSRLIVLFRLAQSGSGDSRHLCKRKSIFLKMRSMVQRTFEVRESNATYDLGPNARRKSCLLQFMVPITFMSLPQ